MTPLVSVVTPTRAATRHLLPDLHRCLVSQTVASFEWLILDDQAPDAFVEELRASDKRVRYSSVAATPHAWTLGEKRNLLVAIASAPLVAHADDDDLYGPRYLERMLAEFVDPHVQLAKLSTFYVGVLDELLHWDTSDTTSPYLVVDPDGARPAHLTHDERERLMRAGRVGYGFSYVYRRDFAETHPFAQRDWDEDSPLAWEAHDRRALALVEDSPDDPLEALAVHRVHRHRTSRCFATRRVPAAERAARLGWVADVAGPR